MRTGGAGMASRSGFSLLEVIIAVFLGALVLTGTISFLFSMGQLWGRGAEERLFEKHVRGVSRFLEESFHQAGLRLEQDAEQGPVYWAERGGRQNLTTQYLTFELDRGPGLLVWPDEPLPRVVCSLQHVPDDGLYLLWRSRLEDDFQEAEPRRTLVSPFVTAMRYHYLDYADENDDWEILDDPEREPDGSYLAPQRIELVFKYKEETVRRQIALPTIFNGVPLF